MQKNYSRRTLNGGGSNMEDEKNQNNVDTQTTTDNAQKEQKPETKNEGEKTKKQVAQKGEDGSIVFKNQDELDGFIRRMYAKGAEKAEQGETSKQVQETQNKQEEQRTRNGTTNSSSRLLINKSCTCYGQSWCKC